MTAKVLPLPTTAATRDTVAAVHSAMQLLAHFRKAPAVPTDERPRLELVPLGARPRPHPRCACGEPSCQAGSLWDAYFRLRAAWLTTPGQDYTPVALAWSAYELASMACFARICPHLKHERRIVTVESVDLDSGCFGDIRYLVRKEGQEFIVTPLPNQPGVTERDAEFYRDAAAGQARLEDELGVGR